GRPTDRGWAAPPPPPPRHRDAGPPASRTRPPSRPRAAAASAASTCPPSKPQALDRSQPTSPSVCPRFEDSRATDLALERQTHPEISAQMPTNCGSRDRPRISKDGTHDEHPPARDEMRQVVRQALDVFARLLLEALHFDDLGDQHVIGLTDGL